MTDRTNAERQRRFRQKRELEATTLRLEKFGLELENQGLTKLLEQEKAQNSVVLYGLWEVIKMQHDAMTATGTAMEWIFDIAPQEYKAEAAKRSDIYNDLLNSCDKLIAPMRAIMEEDNGQTTRNRPG